MSGDGDEVVRVPDRMSDTDRILWVIEQNPRLRSTITSVLFLDRTPDLDRLRRRFERATRRVPRLRQRVVGNPLSLAPPRWQVDPDFRLDDHLHVVTLAGDRSRDAVLRLAEPIAQAGFDRRRALWEVTVVEGLEGGEAAIVAKLHHALTDGHAAVMLMLELVDLERDAAGPDDLPPEPTPDVLGPLGRLRDGLRHELDRQADLFFDGIELVDRVGTDPAGATREALALARSATRLATPGGARPYSPLLRQQSSAMAFRTVDVPVEGLKAAARVAGGKLNDAYVAALVLGLRRWHRSQGVDVPALRMGMPVDVRGGAAAPGSGNRFVPARVVVPLDVDDPAALLAVLVGRLRAERDEPALALVEPLAGLIGRLPHPVITGLFTLALRGQDFNASNVMGVDVPIYLAGAQVVTQYAFGPLSGVALMVTLLSSCGTASIGVSVDPVAVPDVDGLVDALRGGFDDVLALAPGPASAPGGAKASRPGKAANAGAAGTGGRPVSRRSPRAGAPGRARTPRR